MKPAPFLTARNVLLFSLAAEAVTALAVIVAPGLVAQLLLHADISGAPIVFGRLLGVTQRPAGILMWPAAVEPALVTLLLLKPALRGRAAPVD